MRGLPPARARAHALALAADSVETLAHDGVRPIGIASISGRASRRAASKRLDLRLARRDVGAHRRDLPPCNTVLMRARSWRRSNPARSARRSVPR
jgi:hypothetical protein